MSKSTNKWGLEYVIPLSLVLQEHLEARGYLQAEFAHRCGRGVVGLLGRIALRSGELGLWRPNDSVTVGISGREPCRIGAVGLVGHLLASRIQ